jgi:hypothetical protein
MTDIGTEALMEFRESRPHHQRQESSALAAAFPRSLAWGHAQ